MQTLAPPDRTPPSSRPAQPARGRVQPDRKCTTDDAKRWPPPTAALRATLDAVVMQAALDDHYERYPQARPDLGDLAIAAAELDGHPLAGQPQRLRQAAAEITANHPGASPDDVLLWAEARALPAA